MIIYVSTANLRDYSSAPIDGWSTIPVEVPDNFSGGNKTYIPETGEWITDPPYVRTHEDDVRDAVQRQKALIDDAMQSIGIIQLKLQAERQLTVAETEKLNATLDYIDEVTAIDTSAAPNIAWPGMVTSAS